MCPDSTQLDSVWLSSCFFPLLCSCWLQSLLRCAALSKMHDSQTPKQHKEDYNQHNEHTYLWYKREISSNHRAFWVWGRLFFCWTLLHMNTTDSELWALHWKGPQQLCAYHFTNLVRTAQAAVQPICFRSVVPFLFFFNVQRAVVSSGQLQLQTLWITGVVQFRAALTRWSFFIFFFFVFWFCRRFTLFLSLTAAVFLWLQLTFWRPRCRVFCAVVWPRIQLPLLGQGVLQRAWIWGDGTGAALSGQSAVARFFRGLEAEPLAASWTVAPVELSKAGFPGRRGEQCSSL